MQEISNTIKKAEETLGAEKGDNNTVSKSEKSKGEELLPTLTGIYQRVRDSLNELSPSENDKKYTKIKEEIGKELTEDQVNTLIKFLGMCFGSFGFKMPQN